MQQRSRVARKKPRRNTGVVRNMHNNGEPCMSPADWVLLLTGELLYV